MLKRTFMATLLLAVLLFPLQGFSRGKEKPGIINWPLEADGWKWNKAEKRYLPRTLHYYSDGAAEVYLAYNFRQATVRRYEKPKNPPIMAEVYQMASSEDAFGVFSFERRDPEAGIGQGSEFGGGLLRFWKGRYFVTIYGEGEGKGLEEAVLDLGRHIEASIKETGDKPKLLSYLPEGEIKPVEKSVRFIRSNVLLNQRLFISRENILNLRSDVGAVVAEYALGKPKTSLLIVQYPTEARAEEAFTTFKGKYMADSQSGLIRTDNGAWTKAERHGAFIVVALDALHEADAEQLVRATKAKLKKGGS